TVLITIIISILIIGIIAFSNYNVTKFYEIPIYIRKFKNLIYSNEDYNKITNLNEIVHFFNRSEVKSFFKRIFPIIEIEVNQNSKNMIYFKLENEKFYEFLIYKNKLSLVKLNSNEFLSAKNYHDRRNAIIDKKCLKIFFKNLVDKSKNPGTDYMDNIAEKKKDDIYQDIANMIGNTSFL
ncbi:hypothetical protein LCGC14_2875290, partial [marine sediment metagenome]